MTSVFPLVAFYYCSLFTPCQWLAGLCSLQRCLHSSWQIQHSAGTFLRDFGQYWHDSVTRLLQISHLWCDAPVPPHPEDAHLLRSSDCGGHARSMNSLSYSRNRFEISVHIIMLEGASMIIWGTVGIKGVHGQQPYSGTLGHFKQCSVGTKGPKECQENIPHVYIPSPAWTVSTRLYFHGVEVKLWSYQPNVTTHQTRQHFSDLLLSKFGESVQSVPFVADGGAPDVLAHLLQGSVCGSFWDALLHTLCVISGYLSFCCLPVSSKQ